MNLRESLNQIAENTIKYKASVSTEEATITTFVMPFINALGYDAFNPEEVIPQFTADIGIKKGEKVDYAIRINEKISILIECKKLSSKLDAQNESQLHRYFHTTEARIAILTNGVDYKFYSDLDNLNIMDKKPFFEFSIQQLDDSILEKLKYLTKQSFNIDKLLPHSTIPSHISKPKITIYEPIFSEPENEFETEKFSNCLALAKRGNVNAQYEVGLM